MPVVTSIPIILLIPFLCLICSTVDADDGDCSNKEYATIRITPCPRAIFRQGNTPGFTRFQVGMDENQFQFNVCRANLTGTFLVGKGYTYNRIVNGIYISENCWVAVNGTEYLVTQSDKIQYLVYENLRPYSLLWVSIENFNCFPLSTLFIKTGTLPKSPKQYIGRFSYETDDGIKLRIPGAINENNTEVIIGTYGGSILQETHYEIPICVFGS